MQRKKLTFFVLVCCVLLTGAVCWIDLVTPMGSAGGVAYVVVVLITLWLPRRSYTLFFVGLSLLLVVADYLVVDHQGDLWVLLTNRAFAIFAIIVTGLLVIKQHNSRVLLEQRVAQKTEALFESTQLFRSSFDNAAIGKALVATDGSWIEVNRSLCNLLGYEYDDLMSCTFQDITHPDDLEADLAKVQQMVRGEIESYQMEKRYFHHNGSIVWVLLSVSAVRDDQGEVEYFISQIQDITERKQATTLLKASEARLRNLTDAVADAIITADQQGRVLEWNAGAEAIFGYTRAEMDGELLDVIMPSRYHEVHEQGMARYNRTREAYVIGRRLEEYALRRTGEEFPVDIALSMWTSDDEPFYTAIIRDITERKREEAEREALIAELEAKNAELERFTYTVSHDLKSPLVTIQGFTGMLRKDLGEGNTERINEDLQYIVSAADTMQTLLSELLDLSRVGRLVNHPEPVSLTDLAEATVVHLAGRVAERGAEVSVGASMPVVKADRVRLQEVLQNLIENALKFSRPGVEPHVEIGARVEGSEVLCWVRDNGRGIAPAYLERVFDLFERLGQDVEGTGIGLALAKRIVEVHGGRIWVESGGEGQGSTFYFTLPMQ